MELDLLPVWVTLKLAFLTTAILLVLGLPLAWWLATTRHLLKAPVETFTALPLVLPPTVLGFYLLVLLGNNGPFGALWNDLFGQPLAFTFTGILLASCLYSLPFVVQPLQTAFEGINRKTVEASWTLGASRLKTFFRIVLPQARRGLIVATVLGFAHTVGEFGVVLMVGGNIPGETQVLSIAIYDLVETLDYRGAHLLSLGLLIFSFVTLFIVYGSERWRLRGELA